MEWCEKLYDFSLLYDIKKPRVASNSGLLILNLTMQTPYGECLGLFTGVDGRE
ncbi:hypothetical protein SHDE107825_12725 [Shewanella denitrificans]|jgi:hypothetical protein